MDIQKVLEQHKIWINSLCKDGKQADLRQANLRYAKLSGVDLSGLDLRYANLIGADLRGANLSGANLSGADLRYADLRYANLSGANLSDANLFGANLSGADLSGVDLRDADLRGAYLPESTFIISDEQYFISICRDCVRAGCQCHSVNEWRQFSKSAILKMDGKASLKFYPRLLDIIDFYCGKGERPEWLKEKNNG